MFKFVGDQAISGAIKKLGESGPELGKALVSAGKGIFQMTVIPPILLKIGKEIPEYWDGLPKDQKQALFNALVAAGTKAASEYAKKPV